MIETGWLGGLNREFCLRFAQTLLHFLWQGSAVAALVVLFARSRAPARVRYGANVAGLLLMAACVPLTFAALADPASEIRESHETGESGDELTRGAADAGIPPRLLAGRSSDVGALSGPARPWRVNDRRAASSTESHAAALSAPIEASGSRESRLAALAMIGTLAYFAGAALMLLRVALGVCAAHRLQGQATPAAEPALWSALETQARRVGLRAAPAVAYCQRIAVPVVVGILKPTILLPTSLASGFAPDQLEAILTHELAHIRRWDLWVNLLQRVVESLLFFHPAVWFVSRQVSAERELCCDDLVLSTGCQRMSYADALIRMAERCSPQGGSVGRSQLAALAATGGSVSLLRRRVMRVLGDDDRPKLRLTRLGATVAVLLVASIALLPELLRKGARAQQGQSELGAPSELTPASPIVPGIQEAPEKQGQDAVPEDKPMSPTEEQARAAFKKAGVHVQISSSKDAFFRGGPDDAFLNLDFSGTKVTDEWMPYLLAFPDATSLQFSESTQVTDKALEIIGQLGKLRSLRLASSQVTGSGLKHLANCSSLTSLNVKSRRLRDDALTQLGELAKLKLVALTIGGWQSSDAGLVEVGKLTSLESLALHVGQTADGEALATGRTLQALAPLSKLKSLEIMGDDVRQHAAVRDDDLAALADLPQLTSLTLSSRLLTDEALKHIGGCQELRELTLWHAPLTDDGLRHLSPLTKLRSVQLFGARITGTGFRFLNWPPEEDRADRPDRPAADPGLRQLSVIGVSATDAGVAEIAKLATLKSLRIGPYGWFDKEASGPLAVTNAGLAHLAMLKNLNSLDLSLLQVTDAGLAKLSDCAALRELGLAKLPITDKGIRRLSELKHLNSLGFRDCSALTQAGIVALHQSKPDIRITVEIDRRQIGLLHHEHVMWEKPRIIATQESAAPEDADADPPLKVREKHLGKVELRESEPRLCRELHDLITAHESASAWAVQCATETESKQACACKLLYSKGDRALILMKVTRHDAEKLFYSLRVYDGVDPSEFAADRLPVRPQRPWPRTSQSFDRAQVEEALPKFVTASPALAWPQVANDQVKTTFKVSGTVVDAETGAPIRGIMIQGGRVDKEGKTTWGYSLKGRAQSPTFQESIRWDDGWRARVIAPGYKSQPILQERPKMEVVTGMVLKLARGATVKGRVLDADGKPVNAARLFVVGARPINVHGGKAWKDFELDADEDKTVAQTVSDEQGRFTLTGIDDEFNQIAISAKKLDLWVVSAKGHDATQQWVIRLPKPNSLTIEYDIRGGPQTASFMIQMATHERADWKFVQSARTVRVENGAKLTLSNLPESGYTVSRLKEIRTGARIQVVFCEQQRIQVGPAPGLAKYVRTNGAGVKGRVVGIPQADQPEEQIDGALVYVRPADATADPRKLEFEKPTYDAFRVDKSGEFATEQLAPGKYKLVAHAYRAASPSLTSGIELPHLVGEALVTIQGSNPPAPVQIELKPLAELDAGGRP